MNEEATQRGLLISFEGIDGSGKSTQVQRLRARLAGAGYDPLYVREPGGTPLSEHIRALLLDPAFTIDPFAELLLFSAARAQLVAQQIRPALAAGRVVLCDRFYDSTTAYQGGGRGLEDPAWLDGFNQHVTGNLAPDRTYLIDLDPAAALARRADRGTADDRMEAGGLAFAERVAAAYRTLAQRHPQRVLALDGTQPIDRLHQQIWADLAPRLPAPGTAPDAAGSG